MTIKYKLLLFETLTVIFNLIFGITTTSYILNQKIDEQLSEQITKSAQNFTSSIKGLNLELHESMENNLRDKDNISNFEFLIENDAFRSSSLESFSSLYYRIIKKVTKSLYSHGISNSIDEIYLLDRNKRIISVINIEKTDVYFTRTIKNKPHRVQYRNQFWEEELIDSTKNSPTLSRVNDHGSSLFIENNSLFLKSITKFQGKGQSYFWIVAKKRIQTKTIGNISKKLDIFVFLTRKGKILTNFKNKLAYEDLKQQHDTEWRQYISGEEYFLSKRRTLKIGNEESLDFFFATSLANIKLKNKTIVINIAIALAVFGILSLIALSYLVKRFLITPISELKQKANEIAEGNLNTQINIKGNDEIALLAKNFEYLRDSVRMRIEDFNNIKDGLEQTVKDRTYEVTAKNKELGLKLHKIETLQTTLITKEKMATFGVLTEGLAHEIKNPLNVIKSSAHIVEEYLNKIKQMSGKELSAPEIKKMKEISELLHEPSRLITKHSDRINTIIQFMLSSSSSTTEDTELIDLCHLIDTYLNFTYQNAKKNDVIKTEIYKIYHSTPIVRFNQNKLAKVFISMFDNAFGAIREKSIKSTADYRPSMSIEILDQEKQVEIRIRDNGIGIKSENIEKIFDPFFTTKAGTQGAGLGLYQCYDIINSDGGEISVKSKENEFTEFSIVLKK